jgi:hypothetical protein
MFDYLVKLLLTSQDSGWAVVESEFLAWARRKYALYRAQTGPWGPPSFLYRAY